MHEYYSRRLAVEIVNERGQSMALSEMIARPRLSASGWASRRTLLPS